MPSTAGLPTLTSPPSLTSRTRPSFTEEPGSAARRSTRMRSPGATRYCLPPLTITADSELSGLGTASDFTGKPAPRSWEAAPPHSWGGGAQRRRGSAGEAAPEGQRRRGSAGEAAPPHLWGGGAQRRRGSAGGAAAEGLRRRGCSAHED